VGVHHGTRETAARLVDLGGRFYQLRLERELVPARGDRLVIRSLAPPDTLGGGVVLDPRPRRHGPSRDLLVRLTRLERGEEPEPAMPAAPKPKAPAPEPVALTPAQLRVEERLRAAGHTPPLDAELDAGALAALREAGRAVRLGPSMHIHPEPLAAVERRVAELIERDGEVTIASLRDDLGTSRKYAQALLEHCDAARITLRVGDRRVLRRRHAG
jgi:selenocysteine-specific elongation factor